MVDDICRLTAAALSAKLRDGEITAEQLARTCLARIAAREADVRAWSYVDPDQPIPELFTDGHQSSLAKWIGKTPREVAISQSTKAGIDFTGTMDHVAGMMQEIMEEVGGDGFLFFNGAFDRR